MGRVTEPAAAFVEQRVQGSHQRPSLIVLHTSFTTADSGAAFAMAHTLHRNDAKNSYHYFVDAHTVIKGVEPKWIALSKQLRKGSIDILVADDPAQSMVRWEDFAHRNLLLTLSELVAHLCLFHKIPPRLLTGHELLKWEKWHTKRRGGIITDGSLGTSTWPQEHFMKLVDAHMSQIKMAHTK